MVDYRGGDRVGSQNLQRPERVLTVGAHPDDAEFGAGGTLAKWADGGAHITMLVITDGSKGTWDVDLAPDALIERRQREQDEAAAALGASRVIGLGHVDGELEYTMTLRAEICRHIREIKPDVVLGHDPWRRYMIHPDHRAAGWAVVDGVVAARDHLFFTEQLQAGMTHHRPGALLLWAADEPDHLEDISGYIEAKVAALVAHSSQGVTTMDGAGTSEDATAAFAAEIAERARRAGGSGIELAERFKLIVP